MNLLSQAVGLVHLPTGIPNYLIIALAVPCTILAVMALRRRGLVRSVLLPATFLAPDSSELKSWGDRFRLELIEVEEQTHDAKSLHFRVPEGIELRAKPGQFLTLDLNIDGKKVTRSYTVCSSPLKTGQAEITPKRTKNGYVSAFLNERAAPGLVVNASGPYGQFYFDEERHTEIVLIAGGSGITPMIAMLRYIEDKSLSTCVTLIYSVHTPQDIIFQRELTRLSRSLPHFRLVVTTSNADVSWKGCRGRLSSALFEEHVSDFRIPTFFLCGPNAFMQLAMELLKEQGVAADRIKVESFGENSPSANSGGARISITGTVEFLRSGLTCALTHDMTVLELAEKAGVPIPFGCRQGQCGTCATHLLCGNVAMDAEDGLSIEQKKAGFILPCVSKARDSICIDA